MLATGGLGLTMRITDCYGDSGLGLASRSPCRRRPACTASTASSMSCRVLSRGVEHLLCNHVLQRASESGYRRVHGIYRPTARNEMVRGLYQSLGFESAEPVDGGEHWLMETGAFVPFETTIELAEEVRLALLGGGDD